MATYNFPVPGWNQYKKQTFDMTPKGIVTHNTYNSASAKSEASYMVGNSNWTSFHSSVDENAVYESIPFNKNAWHCGATYGNRNYIGIEIARSTGSAEQFAQAERNASKYIAGILRKYNWGLDYVQTHQKQSGKYCPHRTLDLGWQRFLNMVNTELRGGDVAVNLEKPKSAGYSVKTKTPGDVLNIRSGPGAGYKKIGTYRDGSVIYVESVHHTLEGTWYKIPRVGYVSAKFCVGM